MGDHLEISDEVVDFFENLKNEGNEEVVEAEGVEPAVEEAQEPVETVETEQEGEQPTEVVEEQEEAPEAVSEQETETNEDDSWEARYKNLQAQKDREVAATQQQLAQLQEWAQQQYAWQQQLIAEQQRAAQAQQAQPQQQAVTQEEVSTALDQNPVQTFQWIAYNRPDLVPNLITMVRGKENLGDEVADRFSNEWTQFQIAKQE